MSQLLLYEYAEGNPLRITGVDAGLLSPDEIRRRSVAQITEPVIYEKNVPKIGGVNDHRLGVVDRTFRCGTCGGMVGKCQGHEGHIELPWPVYHVGQIDKILKVLRLVCFACSRLLFDPAAPKYRTILESTSTKDRLNALAQAAKTVRKCRHDDGKCCAYKQPAYARAGLIITCDYRDMLDSLGNDDERQQLTQHPFTARDALDIMKNISESDSIVLGFNPRLARPEWMIQTVVLVSSPVIRPAITETSGSRTKGQDDLTKKTVDIVKAARNVEKWRTSKLSSNVTPTQWLLNDCPPPPPLLLEELQLHTATLINNEVRGAKQSVQRSGQPTKSIATRLKGKEGRVRGNLMGKRVDHSGRNVISPDACIDANQLGVSMVTAKKLIYPERVNVYNYKLLTDAVRRGAKQAYGAYAIAMQDRSVVYLEPLSDEQRQQIQLELGWTVFRFIRDKDWVVFNRQPSLHRGSMLAFQSHIQPGTTSRLNLANTPTFNADFDGDEMNIHMPMSELTRAEARELLANDKHMITPQSHRPIIALVQDALVGAFLLTRKNVFFQKHEVMQLVMAIKHPVNGKGSVYTLPAPAICKPRELWTGKQVFSILFPRRLHVKRRVRDCKDPKDYFDPHERIVRIHRGELLTGSLCKQTVGATHGSIVGIIYRDVSSIDAMNFVSDAQRVVHAYMMQRGLSLGVEDVMCPASADARIDELLEKFVTHVDTKLQPLQDTALAGVTKGDVNQAIMRLGNNALGIVGSVVTSSASVDNNALYATSVAGSKGSKFNMTQIQGTLGAQVVEGQSIQPDVYSNRTLPCYAPGERSVKSRGFVCNNFERGLRPQEMFFHAMSGRESLSDVAVKTSNIGYMQRRCMKSMESLTVQYDRTVRNADNAVVEFAYGFDNIDAIKGDKLHVKELTMSYQQLQKRLGMHDTTLVSMMARAGTSTGTTTTTTSTDGDMTLQGADDDNNCHSHAHHVVRDMLQREYEQIVALRTVIQDAKRVGGMMHGKIDNTLYVSVNVPRFVARWKPVRSAENAVTRTPTTTPVTTLDSDNDRNHHVPLHCRVSCAETLACVDRLCQRIRLANTNDAACASIQFVIRSYLTCYNMIVRYGFDADSLCEMADAIYVEYVSSMVHAGDGVGAIAAESIGEPTTQMTLNTFHFAGVMEKNVTLGVPRLAELIDATTKMKKPSMTVHLNKPFANTLHGADIVRHAIEYLTLEQVVKSSGVVLATDPVTLEEERFAIVLNKLLLAPSVDNDTVGTHVTAVASETTSLSVPFVPTEVNGSSAPQQQQHHHHHSGFSRFVIRYALNKSALMARGLGPEDVHIAISRALGADNGRRKARIVSSEQNMQEWFIRIELGDIPDMVSRVRVSTASVNYNNDNGGSVSNSGGSTATTTAEDMERNMVLRVMTDLLESCVLGGVPKIKRATVAPINSFVFNPTTGLDDKVTEYVLYTEGTDLHHVLTLPSVDATRTISNDIHEVNDILGIDAASDVLYQEIKQVLSFDGTYVQDRHILLAVHTMTWRGYFVPMNRHGMSRMQDGFMMQASFEETYDVVNDANAFGMQDGMRGVTSNIMMGQSAPMGTCMFSVMNEQTPPHSHAATLPTISNNTITADQALNADDRLLLSMHSGDASLPSDGMQQHIGRSMPMTSLPTSLRHTPSVVAAAADRPRHVVRTHIDNNIKNTSTATPVAQQYDRNARTDSVAVTTMMDMSWLDDAIVLPSIVEAMQQSPLPPPSLSSSSLASVTASPLSSPPAAPATLILGSPMEGVDNNGGSDDGTGNRSAASHLQVHGQEHDDAAYDPEYPTHEKTTASPVSIGEDVDLTTTLSLLSSSTPAPAQWRTNYAPSSPHNVHG